MLMKKIVALRNKQTKPAELVFFESLVKDNSVLRLNVKYIYDSTSLSEAAYHVWLINTLFRTFPTIYGGNYEVVFRIEKEREYDPPIFNIILLYEGRYIAELFDLDIRQTHKDEVKKGLKVPLLPDTVEIKGFIELLGKVTVLKDVLKDSVENAVSLDEAVHGIWLLNETMRQLLMSGSLQQKYGRYEIWLTAKKDEERSPVSFKALLVYKGRVIATLFENIEIQ